MENYRKILRETENKITSSEKETLKHIKLAITETISIFTKLLDSKPKLQFNDLDFKLLYNEKIGLDEVQLSKENNYLEIRILDYPKRKKYYILLFLIVKASLLCFYDEFQNENKNLADHITISWLCEIFDFRDMESRILLQTANARHMHDHKAGGTWRSIIRICIQSNITSIDILKQYKQFKSQATKSETIEEMIIEWIRKKSYDSEYLLTPVFIDEKTRKLIDTLLTLGFEESSTSKVASILGIHENTVRDYYTKLSSKFNIRWQASINFPELDLHNYLLKIYVKKETQLNKVSDFLKDIPYLKTIYNGFEQDSQIAYSPNLTCPHYQAEILYRKLEYLKDKSIIQDFYLELVKEKSYNYVVANRPINPTIKNLRGLLNDKSYELTKFSVPFYKEDRSIESLNSKRSSFDYQLLHYLSVILGIKLKKVDVNIKMFQVKSLFEYSNISEDDVNGQAKLLNYLRTEACNKKFLDFYLFFRTITKIGNNIMIVEFPKQNMQIHEIFKVILEKLNIFSLSGLMYTNNRVILAVPGIEHTHPIGKEVKQLLGEEEIDSNQFTVRTSCNQYIPFHDLFDFEKKRWKIVDLSSKEEIIP